MGVKISGNFADAICKCPLAVPPLPLQLVSLGRHKSWLMLGHGPRCSQSTSLARYKSTTGPSKKMVPRLWEFFRQGQAEVVSNSKNKSLATWEPFFLPGPVYFSLLSEIYPVWGFVKLVSTATRQEIWRLDSCNLLDRNKYALLSNTWFKCPSLNWVKSATHIYSKVNALPAVTAQNELRDIKLGAWGRDSIYRVTHNVGPNSPFTWKHKLRFNVRGIF